MPVSNRVYLEAVLGKDTTAKRDDAVKRTSAESSRSSRWRLFGLFGRDRRQSQPSTTQAPTSSKMHPQAELRTRHLAPTSDQRVRPKHDPTDSASGNAKKGDDSTTEATAKKDDAVQKAAVDETPHRLGGGCLIFFRRGDDS